MQLTEEHYRIGKIAYDAYCKQTGGKSLISGDPLPAFDSLKWEIRDAWAAAAIAVSNEERCRRNAPPKTAPPSRT